MLRTPRMSPPLYRRPLWAAGGLLALATAFIVLGHDGRRVAQMLVLFLPAVAWLAWPVRSPAAQRVRHVAVWACALVFFVDGALRGYLLDAYGAAPNSALVLGAMANSNSREAGEYLQTTWRSILLWLVLCTVAAAVAWRLAGKGAVAAAAGVRRSRLLGLAVCACLLVASIGYVSKPWRRLHPVAFWPAWAASLEGLRSSQADQHQMRETVLARARALAPSVARDGPATVVLVISDSINRDNMSLYGYARATTPRLNDLARQLGGQMLTLRNAWSVDASTLPSLRNIFSFGSPDAQNAQHLLALARTAGYKVWWMGNHDDIAIEQQHARLADVVDLVNRTPGRAGASLDGELLDNLQAALEDAAPRKLIVVHLLGAHPHYRLRFPADQNPFDDTPDIVDQQLEQKGRPAWVRRFRQDYDAAVLYHDFVVAETLQLTRAAGAPAGYRAWMYLSDHGQEVGHERNQVGHSPGSESGYRIPTLLWSNDPAPAEGAAIAARPFRADWAGWTLARLMHLRWAGQQPSQDVVDAQYRWQAPRLPITVSSFER
jgi:heptose-I-phosphate ethanolaminephosphotransferase